MLCNSAGGGQSRSSTSTASMSSLLGAESPEEQRRRARKEHLASVAETTTQLRAFESALEELVAFAGGGSGDGAAKSNHELHASRSGASLFDLESGKSSSRLVQELASGSSYSPQKSASGLLVDRGGGDGGRARHLYNAEELISHLLSQNGRADDLSAANQMQQSLIGVANTKNGRDSISGYEDEAVEQYLSVLFANKLRSNHKDEFSNNDTVALDQQPTDTESTTQVPVTNFEESTTSSSTNQHASSSPAGWLGRPFRGFSPFSFKLTNSVINSADTYGSIRQQDESLSAHRQNQNQQQYQYLKPIDRPPTEPYSDIVVPTEPSTQHNLTWVLSGSHHLAPAIDQQQQHNHHQQYQQQHQKANNQLQNGIFANLINSSADPQQASLVPGYPAMPTPPLVEQRPPYRIVAAAAAPPTDRDLHQLQPQNSRRPQQQQSGDDEIIRLCKCDELDIVQTNNELCRFRCQQQRDNSGPSSSITPEVGGQLMTATTFVTPSTTLSPSAKMSPIDVTFLLYTRSPGFNQQQQQSDVEGSVQPLTIEQLAVYPFSSQQNETSTQTDNFSGANEPPPPFAGFNSSIPIKIVIHGFGSGGRKPWVSDMVMKLLEYEDAHVIVVDWEKGAAMPNYVQAAGNTRLVGHKIATLIKSINAKFGLTGNNYHLIGFSLGAHVAGFAGMEIRNSSSSPRFWINRITGLDPASPLFEGYEANDRLDPSDAQFVDVIHSNGDGVLRGGFGSLQPMGHVDFYPNGGRVQVGCNSVLLSALSDIIYGKWQSLCNHRRALNFFMDSFESKNNCRFRSFNCDSYESYLKGECFDCGPNNEKCSYMGYMADHSKGRGKMYLTTHEEAPFCANQFTIKILGTKGFKSHWGKVEVTLVSSDGKNESFWLSSMSQQSAGHDLMGSGASSGNKELISQQQHSMQSLVVAHTSLDNFTQVLLRYTKYKGWIYSGDENWPIDKVFITDSEGQVRSFCGFNTVLESHITSRLQLEARNCTVKLEPNHQLPPTTNQQQQPSTPASNLQQLARAPGPIQSLSVSQQLQQQQQQVTSNQQHQHSSRTPRLYVNGEPTYLRMALNGDRQQQQQQFAPLFNMVHQTSHQSSLPALVSAF